MGELAPGKGIHIDLDIATVDFLKHTCDEVYEADAKSESSEHVIRLLVGEYDWTFTSDSFGDKAHKAHSISMGTELRVTVVLKRKELKLDVRTWYTPA